MAERTGLLRAVATVRLPNNVEFSPTPGGTTCARRGRRVQQRLPLAFPAQRVGAAGARLTGDDSRPDWRRALGRATTSGRLDPARHTPRGGDVRQGCAAACVCRALDCAIAGKHARGCVHLAAVAGVAAPCASAGHSRPGDPSRAAFDRYHARRVLGRTGRSAGTPDAVRSAGTTCSGTHARGPSRSGDPQHAEP